MHLRKIKINIEVSKNTQCSFYGLLNRKYLYHKLYLQLFFVTYLYNTKITFCAIELCRQQNTKYLNISFSEIDKL